MMSTASRQCAIEGFGLMAVSSIVEMDRQRPSPGPGRSESIFRNPERIVGLTGHFSARFQGCLSFFRFGADFGETIREAAKAGSGSAAQQCPPEHLENVLRTQEGIDDAVEAGSKTPVASLAGHLYRESARPLVSI